MVDAGRLARPRPYARARSDSGKGKNVNDTYRNDQMRMTSSIEIMKYNSLTSSVVYLTIWKNILQNRFNQIYTYSLSITGQIQKSKKPDFSKVLRDI